MSFSKTVLIAAILVSGCAVNKSLIATGGSRADGTVELSYEYGGFEQPKVDFATGIETARQRCSRWGYSDAERFGGLKRSCQFANQYGCARWLATLTYQCLGTPKT